MSGSILSSPDALIEAQVERFRADFRLVPVTASEIEFYLHGSRESAAIADFWSDVSTACAAAGMEIFNHNKETGEEQHEIALAPCNNAIKTARDTVALKSILGDAATRYGMRIDFSAKPFVDRPGSGLHIHVHLTDEKGINTFYKDDVAISSALQYSIGGMLAWISASMPVFAPSPDSYNRFAPGGNAPLTLSWGANNRTVAIRLPQAAHTNKHIEHRVAGSDADPLLTMAVILAAMHYGLKYKIDPGAQQFGDASLPMYGLPRIPTTLEDALKSMKDAAFLADYFSVEDLLPMR